MAVKKDHLKNNLTIMPIPRKSKNETKNEYVSKCISAEMKKGHPQQQAIAMCIASWNKFDAEQIIEVASLKLKKD